MLFSPLKSFPHKTSHFYTYATLLNSFHHLLIQLLQSSIDHQSLPIARQSHALIYFLGFDQDPFLATKLITAYSKCNKTSDSRLVFDSIRHKNVFLWNSMINGYAKNCIFKEPLCLLNQMCIDRIPDNYTFATISKICGEFGDVEIGKMFHCRIIRTGFMLDTVVANSLMSMYCKFKNLSDVCIVFDEMPQRNVASWNVLIFEYAVLGDFLFNEEIWKLTTQMQIEGMKPDSFTVASLLPLCASGTGRLDYGREIHCFIMRNELGLGSELHVQSCLIDMYSKSENVAMGRHVFDSMNYRNVVVWTAMIAGYVQNGDPEEALTLFCTMQMRDGIVPNKISLVSILPACATIAGLVEGKQIHGFAVRSELDYETSVSNALIDMYSKCGSLKYARHVFDNGSFFKDAISWSSIIAGYGLHGRGEEAIVLFYEMLQLGIKPDHITFVGVISACGRVGLIAKGFEIYNLLTMDFGISPTVEICSCMVDMLGRAGQLDQALNFITSMPVKPGPSVWGALFSNSVIHGNSKMQDVAYGSLLQIEPENPSNYVALSNVNASFGRWDVVAGVRMRMKERGLTKLPGCSWISVDGKIHSFYVADQSHPRSNLIYAILENLILMMKGVDVPNFEYST
ncbi:pentatricopeptide repeat-containing protein At2g13600-like [Tasmannia lanceolata]|uniref:pentatricopeptide repeat-containing protein At2g13600-like n=1 Tax=Tasmannia lanceolata TaxID=3420 RepID=UPI00406376F8